MNQRRTSSMAVWLSAMMLLPVLYVLSLGPAVRLFRDGHLPSEVQYVYAPLEMLGDYCRPVRHVLESYIELWGG